jgi:hypothetical protein
MSAPSITLLLAMTLASPVAPGQALSLSHRGLESAPVESETSAEMSAAAQAEANTAEAAEAVAEPEAKVAPNAELKEAQATRRANPSAENWAREGDLLAAKGERAAAIAAYGEARARSSDATLAAELDGKIDAMASGPQGPLPGTEVVESPASVGEEASPEVPGAALAVNTSDASVEREPIVKKWYFWVTVVAIAASAGAITGIASKAAIDEQKATRGGPLPAPGAGNLAAPALLRF